MNNFSDELDGESNSKSKLADVFTDLKEFLVDSLDRSPNKVSQQQQQQKIESRAVGSEKINSVVYGSLHSSLQQRQQILHSFGFTTRLLEIAMNGLDFEEKMVSLRSTYDIDTSEEDIGYKVATIAINILELMVKGNNIIALFTIDQGTFKKDQSIFSALISKFEMGEKYKWNNVLLEIIRAVYLDTTHLSKFKLIVAESEIQRILRHIFTCFARGELPSPLGYELLTRYAS
jgi:hypothetical protein